MFSLFEKLIVSDKKARYDTQALAILSQKKLMAKLLKEVVPEVKQYSAEEIETFIEGTPKVSKIGVHPNTKLLPRIIGRATESKLLGEGVIKFDLWFNLDIPNEAKPIRIIINVEAQGKENPGYNIVTRAIYYCCRLVSEQYETEFSNSNYDDIKKVYSIWVCMPRKKKNNSVESYSIERYQEYGRSGGTRDRYDLMTAVIIRLGKNKPKDKSFFNVLSAIFSDTISLEEKLHICEENGTAITDKELLERIGNMASFGKAIADDYFEKGIEQGASKEKAATVKRMAKKDMPLSDIAECTDLSTDEVRKILKEIVN